MLQAVNSSTIELHQTPDWSDKPYNVHRDPLWKTTKQSKGFDDVWFYHCDHLGTPQEMSDHTSVEKKAANSSLFYDDICVALRRHATHCLSFLVY